jgi:hypothetical protein
MPRHGDKRDQERRERASNAPGNIYSFRAKERLTIVDPIKFQTTSSVRSPISKSSHHAASALRPPPEKREHKRGDWASIAAQSAGPQLRVVEVHPRISGLNKNQLDFILRKYADKTAPFIETTKLTRVLGQAECYVRGPLTTKENPLPHDRIDIDGRRIANLPPVKTSEVTVVAGFSEGILVLYAAYGGSYVPFPPGDPLCTDRDTSEKFWQEHVVCAEGSRKSESARLETDFAIRPKAVAEDIAARGRTVETFIPKSPAAIEAERVEMSPHVVALAEKAVEVAKKELEATQARIARLQSKIEDLEDKERRGVPHSVLVGHDERGEPIVYGLPKLIQDAKNALSIATMGGFMPDGRRLAPELEPVQARYEQAVQEYDRAVMELANSSDPTKRIAVAKMRRKLPEEALRKLAVDSDFRVRAALSERKDLPEDVRDLVKSR